MDVLSRYNQKRFMGYIPEIRKDPKAWWIIEVALSGKVHNNAAFIALKVREHFGDKQGIIFACGGTDVLALALLGSEVTGSSIAEGLNKKLAQHDCIAQVAEATAEGLAKIQTQLEKTSNDNGHAESGLLTARRNRKERIIMVVDDDSLVRSLIQKNFHNRGKISEFKDIRNVLESYLLQLPNIVFLDIHLPDGSGIDLLREIMLFDDTAFVIILTSDAVADNVIEAKKLGAKGFLVKPFSIEKLEACYKKCPTVS